MAFTHLVPPKNSRNPPKRSKFSTITGPDSPFRNLLALESWMLIAACIQSLLFFSLPPLYAFAPAIVLLLLRVVSTVLVTKNWIANPYLQGTIRTKNSAQLPDVNGDFHGPGTEKVAVLLLGAKINHPMGFVEPVASEFGQHFMRMTAELDRGEDQNNGFLGSTPFERVDEHGAHHVVNISYWRSIEDVHAYAHGPTHRVAWNWWDKNAKRLNHVGIMHEVFEAPAGMWESVYINFQPTMMGATSFLKRGGKLEGGQVAEEWISPIVDASRGALASSKGRRGQNVVHRDASSEKVNVYGS